MCASAGIASAQDLYVANTEYGSIGEYNATSGAVISSSLLPSGLLDPTGIAVSGNDLYVASYGPSAGAGSIGEYDATTGDTINSSLVSGLTFPQGIALSGNDLYVATFNSGIYEFDATTGASLTAGNLPFISFGLSNTAGIAISGTDLYVANYATDNGVGTVSEYNAITGVSINPSLVSGLSYPTGIAVSGTDLYVSYSDTVGEFDAVTGGTISAPFIPFTVESPYGLAVSGTDLYLASESYNSVSEFNAVTGASINNSLVSDPPDTIGEPTYIAVAPAPVPEPSAFMLVGFCAPVLAFAHRRGLWLKNDRILPRGGFSG